MTDSNKPRSNSEISTPKKRNKAIRLLDFLPKSIRQQDHAPPSPSTPLRPRPLRPPNSPAPAFVLHPHLTFYAPPCPPATSERDSLFLTLISLRCHRGRRRCSSRPAAPQLPPCSRGERCGGPAGGAFPPARCRRVLALSGLCRMMPRGGVRVESTALRLLLGTLVSERIS